MESKEYQPNPGDKVFASDGTIVIEGEFIGMAGEMYIVRENGKDENTTWRYARPADKK